jgi:hypothetical protein
VCVVDVASERSILPKRGVPLYAASTPMFVPAQPLPAFSAVRAGTRDAYSVSTHEQLRERYAASIAQQ